MRLLRGLVALFVIATGISIVSATQTGASEAATRAKLMSWNIGPPNSPGTAKWQGIIDTIKRHDPDVLALQEVHVVDEPASGQVAFDEVAALREALPEYVGVVADRTDSTRGGDNFNVILSKSPIVDEYTAQLPNVSGCSNTVDHGHGDGCPVNRSFAGGSTNVNGSDIRVYTTHLTAGDSAGADTLRGQQLDFIAQHVATHGVTSPLAVMGDLNVLPESSHLSKLAAVGLYDSISAVRDFTTPTFHSNGWRLDYAWLSPAFDVTDANVGSAATPYSDHLPLISDLTTRDNVAKVAAVANPGNGWANLAVDTSGGAVLRTCDGAANPYGVMSRAYVVGSSTAAATGQDDKFGDKCQTKSGLSLTPGKAYRVELCRNNAGSAAYCRSSP